MANTIEIQHTLKLALDKIKKDAWFNNEFLISLEIKNEQGFFKRASWTSGALKHLIDVLEPYDLDFYVKDSKTVVIIDNLN
jgi:hypothetical protein